MAVKANDHKSPRRLTATALGAVAVLHVMWGLGSSFPFRSREELADAVVGRDDVPPFSECVAVALALALAAVLVTGALPLPKRIRTVALRVVASTFLTRGVVGALCRTSVLSPGSDSPRFTRLDQRIFSPLCLWLAANVRRSI
jgi:hypothetical protein